MTKTILITGATGYIGSHTWCTLLSAQFNVVGIDNFSNSFPKTLSNIQKLTAKKIEFINGDVRDPTLLEDLFCSYDIDAVIHFAAFKSVQESLEKPICYYENNLQSLFTLTKVMARFDVKKLIFSSSATVYGEPNIVPINETFPLSATSVYGQTKLLGELFLRDLEKADASWRFGILRYFNPVGAHESGFLGEDPRGTPNNLMPLLAQVAYGTLKKLSVYGGDYPTCDGTCVRDYIHVVDLAEGHLNAVKHLLGDVQSFTVNLGTGKGISVLELVKQYELASGCKIPYEMSDRRLGDVSICYADPRKAHDLLGWRAKRGVYEMCRDSWNWQRRNKDGI